jgi:predicted transposase/invertase (TIGR01784 family)
LDLGKLEKSLETAKKMKDKKFSVDEILEITGLTEEELRKNGIL